MVAALGSASLTDDALSKISQALSEVTELSQIKALKALRDEAEASRKHAVAARLSLEVQNRACEARLTAERRAGTILRGMRLRGGDHKSSFREKRPLEMLGITQKESTRWQRAAMLPEADFRQYVRLAKEMGQRLTSRRLFDLVRVHVQQAGSDGESLFKRLTNRLRKLANQPLRFGCIHVLPPWPAAHAPKVNISSFVQGLLDLPVEPIAAARAHLHLWTPPELLEDGLRVLRAWGFSYRTSLVRLKPCTQFGGFWQPAHEVLLLGVRGEVEFPDRSLLSWMDPRTGSEAASLREVRSLIERASSAPNLELFGGEAMRGWTVLP